MKNPAFGKWNRDDGSPDGFFWSRRGYGAGPWDLRVREKSPSPCVVRVGAFVIRDVLFPRRYETIERVRALAHEAVSLHGRLGHPDDYPLPRGFGRHKHLVPLYRYFLARQLAGLG